MVYDSAFHNFMQAFALSFFLTFVTL